MPRVERRRALIAEHGFGNQVSIQVSFVLHTARSLHLMKPLVLCMMHDGPSSKVFFNCGALPQAPSTYKRLKVQNVQTSYCISPWLNTHGLPCIRVPDYANRCGTSFITQAVDPDIFPDWNILQVGISACIPGGPEISTNLDYQSFFDFLMDRNQSYERIPPNRFEIDPWVVYPFVHFLWAYVTFQYTRFWYRRSHYW